MLALLLALAQPSPPPVAGPPAPPPSIAVTIDAPAEVRVGRLTIFRADASGTLTAGTFAWDFGDGGTASGAEAAHVFEKPGVYTARATFTPAGGATSVVSEKRVTAFRTSILLFSASGPDELSLLRADAEKNGNALIVIPVHARSSFLAQETLGAKLGEEARAIDQSDVIVFALPPDSVLNALASHGRTQGGTLAGKSLIILGDRSTVPPRLAQVAVERVAPEVVLFTPSGALPFIVRMRDPATLAADLAQNGWSVERIGTNEEPTPRYALFGRLLDRMLRGGVPSQTILLFLMVPVIITVVTFFRQVVGLSTMGVYVPLTLALSFIVLGVPFALGATAVVFAAGLALRHVLRGVRLMYVPRVGLNLTFLALILLIVLLLLSRSSLVDLSVVTAFPILVLLALSERIFNVVAERKLKGAFFILLETTIVAFVATMVANEWVPFRTFLFAYPEIILVFLGLQWVIGKYTGLRATEVLRFRDLLNEVEYAEEE